ncbi:MAG: hypothetical protein K2X47_09785 [Bdellovibrionales bacterium]|nr:hypothetical protein [Bdellovibrionales bacterium]
MTESDSDSSKRIVLPPQTFNLLTEEVHKIRQRGDNFKVNESKLAVAVLDLFFARLIEKQRDRLALIFFDKKSHLKKLIEEAKDEEELSSSVSAYLKLSRRPRPEN